MIIRHHDLIVELDDHWWAAAQMQRFVPSGRTYRVDLNSAKGQMVFEARIDEIGPVRRAPGIGIFNNNEEKTARERVVCILTGFRTGATIPPIELVNTPRAAPFGIS